MVRQGPIRGLRWQFSNRNYLFGRLLPDVFFWLNKLVEGQYLQKYHRFCLRSSQACICCHYFRIPWMYHSHDLVYQTFSGKPIVHYLQQRSPGFAIPPCSLKDISDGKVNVMLMQDWRISPSNTTITFTLRGTRKPSIPARLNDVFECVCCRFLRVWKHCECF